VNEGPSRPPVYQFKGGTKELYSNIRTIDIFTKKIQMNSSTASSLSPSSSGLEVDLLIFVVLKSEIEGIREVFWPGQSLPPTLNNDDDFNSADYETHCGGYKIIVVYLGGGQGQHNMVSISQVKINQYSPSTVCLIGCAGLFSNDCNLGDVIVADSIDHYEYRSKTKDGEKDNMKIVFGGQVFTADDHLKQKFIFYASKHSFSFKNFQGICKDMATKCISSESISTWVGVDLCACLVNG